MTRLERCVEEAISQLLMVDDKKMAAWMIELVEIGDIRMAAWMMDVGESI